MQINNSVSVSLSIFSFTDKRSDDILEDNIQRNNKSSSTTTATVTSPAANGHHNPGRRKSASGLVENGNSDGGLAPIAQDEDLDSNCNEDDEHGT